MQFFGVAAGSFVASGDLIINGGEQVADAAGKISNAQPANGLSVFPIDVLRFGDG